jgi:hypothetical protein
MTRVEFGFLPVRLAMSAGDVTVETRADFDKIIAGHREWDGVEGDWIYVSARLGAPAAELRLAQ